jgi:hypothetical protein
MAEETTRRPTMHVGFTIKLILERGPMSPYEMWRAYNRNIAALFKRPPVSFNTFYNYLVHYKRLGLIREVARNVPSEKRPHLKRTLYGLTPGREDDPLWNQNIQRVRAMREGWKPTWLGSRRYRRRVLGMPPLPRGRPRKTAEG